jgi:hypothetical protein
MLLLPLLLEMVNSTTRRNSLAKEARNGGYDKILLRPPLKVPTPRAHH